MLIFTALSVTREIERGTMESLLAIRITPFEIMIGKIAPYVLVGFMQAALILVAGVLVFGVRFRQSHTACRTRHAVHRHQPVVRLHLFNTGAKSASGGPDVDNVLFAQHAPVSLRLSVLGMPGWAQAIGKWLPLTHYIRIVRAIMLKGSTLADLQYDTLALAALMAFAMTVALTRFRRTLD